jgi:hypothetical protein
MLTVERLPALGFEGFGLRRDCSLELDISADLPRAAGIAAESWALR